MPTFPTTTSPVFRVPYCQVRRLKHVPLYMVAAFLTIRSANLTVFLLQIRQLASISFLPVNRGELISKLHYILKLWVGEMLLKPGCVVYLTHTTSAVFWLAVITSPFLTVDTKQQLFTWQSLWHVTDRRTNAVGSNEHCRSAAQWTRHARHQKLNPELFLPVIRV